LRIEKTERSDSGMRIKKMNGPMVDFELGIERQKASNMTPDCELM